MKNKTSAEFGAEGGRKRAKSLTKAQRTEIARGAAEARWAAEGKLLPRATHEGTLMIGSLNLPVAVLDGGVRVLTAAAVLQSLGRPYKGNYKRTNLPNFIEATNLYPFITQELLDVLKPVEYMGLRRQRRIIGYRAEILPMVCDVYLAVRAAGKLGANQELIASQAEMLVRSLAKVGIVALIDEATGFQDVRDRRALEEILNQYIGRELAKWAKRFPDEFYQQMFRLKGWMFDPNSSRRPMAMANLTIDLVFDRIGPGLTTELRQRRQEVLETTGKKGKLHQLLTIDVGHPALQHHLSGLIFLAKALTDWNDFYAAVDRVAPRYNRTLKLPFNEGSIGASNVFPLPS